MAPIFKLWLMTGCYVFNENVFNSLVRIKQLNTVESSIQVMGVFLRIKIVKNNVDSNPEFIYSNEPVRTRQTFDEIPVVFNPVPNELTT